MRLTDGIDVGGFGGFGGFGGWAGMDGKMDLMRWRDGEIYEAGSTLEGARSCIVIHIHTHDLDCER